MFIGPAYMAWGLLFFGDTGFMVQGQGFRSLCRSSFEKGTLLKSYIN